MAWISITTADVQRSLAGGELLALQAEGLGDGQIDPLPGIISDVVAEVRGYISANALNRLGDGETIPDRLRATALVRIRFEAFTRLPLGRELLTEDRVKANDNAIQRLRDVAAGRFQIEDPTVIDEESRRAPLPMIGTRTRNFDRDSQDGL